MDYPPQPRPTIPTIEIPPLPPFKPPGEGGEKFCQKILEKCMGAANVCPVPVKQTVTAACLATYMLCRLGVRKGDD
jgi:hypothetical protein